MLEFYSFELGEEWQEIMSTLTASPTHVVYLDRRLVRRLEIGASARAHCASSINDRREARSFSHFLGRMLATRGDRIELRGPEKWFREMVRVCGDGPAAFEIGRQLQAECE